MRRCSGLDSWIVHAWSLKNKELFRIALVDCPCPWEVFYSWIVPAWSLKTRSCYGLDLWIVHAWEVLNSWIVPK